MSIHTLFSQESIDVEDFDGQVSLKIVKVYSDGERLEEGVWLNKDQVKALRKALKAAL